MATTQTNIKCLAEIVRHLQMEGTLEPELQEVQSKCWIFECFTPLVLLLSFSFVFVSFFSLKFVLFLSVFSPFLYIFLSHTSSRLVVFSGIVDDSSLRFAGVSS